MKIQITPWLTFLLCLQALTIHAADNIIEVGTYNSSNGNFSAFSYNGDADQTQYSSHEEEEQKAEELEESNTLGDLRRDHETQGGNVLQHGGFVSTESDDDDEKKYPGDFDHENDDASSLNGKLTNFNMGLSRTKQISNLHTMEVSLSNEQDQEKDDKESSNNTYPLPHPSTHLSPISKLIQQKISRKKKPARTINLSDSDSSNTTKEKIRTAAYSLYNHSPDSSDEVDTSSTEDESAQYILRRDDSVEPPTKSPPSNKLSKKHGHTPKKTKKGSLITSFSSLSSRLLRSAQLHIGPQEDDPNIFSDNDSGRRKKPTVTLNQLSTLANAHTTDNPRVEEDDPAGNELSIQTNDVIDYTRFKGNNSMQYQGDSQPIKGIAQPIYSQQAMGNHVNSHQPQAYQPLIQPLSPHRLMMGGDASPKRPLDIDNPPSSDGYVKLCEQIKKNPTGDITLAIKLKDLAQLYDVIRQWEKVGRKQREDIVKKEEKIEKEKKHKKYFCRAFGVASAAVLGLSGALFFSNYA